jgi:hypothetical protein
MCYPTKGAKVSNTKEAHALRVNPVVLPLLYTMSSAFFTTNIGVYKHIANTKRGYIVGFEGITTQSLLRISAILQI